jgi:ankyrin repeat protein
VDLAYKLGKMIEDNDYVQLERKLKEDPDALLFVDQQGCTLLMEAAGRGSLECAQVLLQMGADVNQRGVRGETALIEAVFWDQYEVAKYLLKQGAEVSDRNRKGSSAFGYATTNDTSGTSWKELFALYKEKFDMEDTIVYEAS